MMTAAAAVPETLPRKRSPLTPNLQLFNASQKDLARMLLDEGQNHLFEHWSEPGTDDLEKENFMRQVEKLHANYPGGLRVYIRNARKLLADSKAGKNPFDGFVPSVPTGEKLSYGDQKFTSFEEIGVAEASKAAFVLVAGGLGERLGYSGIKIALPSETTTGISFLQLYIESILALQSSAGGNVDIPFVIMTSDDTHNLTESLLRVNSYYGMKPGQITLLKQEKVACLADSNAKIALDPNNNYLIQTKPHGHGDVHAVLFSSGLLQKWQQEGRKWVLFFQDTNGLLFKVISAALGVSAAKGWDMNSLAVPRKAKEPIGGIACLTHQNGKKMVINVEYNQLDPLLRATGNVHGDVNDETGYSPYPGNINQLILKLSTYINVLSETHGAIVEFVNPKYKDASRSSFKSSTRLECMMQDFPRSLPASANVGFTVMDAWLAYAPVKNNPEDAAKVPEGNPHHSATTGEMAIYRCNSLILRKAGIHIEEPKLQVFNGQKVELWARIVWKPHWGLKFSDIKRKILGHCKISQRSTLVLWGEEISIHGLTLDGTLVVNALPQAKVELESLQVENKGWAVEPVDYKNESIPEEIRIRGFKVVKHEEKTLEYNTPGTFLVGAEHN